MLVEQGNFQKLLEALGFVPIQKGDSLVMTYMACDDTPLGESQIYFSGRCQEIVNEYIFVYDATTPEVDVVDFVQKLLKSTCLQKERDWREINDDERHPHQQDEEIGEDCFPLG